MNKKHILLLALLVTSIGLFSGCSHKKSSSDSTNLGELEQKNAQISISGNLSQNGELFFITDNTGAVHDIETYSIVFEKYVGQQVTVTGQYSGNTLFVTEISEQ